MSISAAGFFCEDVREESSGTHSIVGVQPDNIFVPAFPGVFPVMWLYVRIYFPSAENPGAMSLIGKWDGTPDKEIMSIDAEVIEKGRAINQERGAPFTGILLRNAMHNFQVNGAGRFSVFLRTQQGELFVAAMNIQEQPPQEATLAEAT